MKFYKVNDQIVISETAIGEEVIESGVYTIVFVADDGTAYGFSADLNQNTHYGSTPWNNSEGEYTNPTMGPQQP